MILTEIRHCKGALRYLKKDLLGQYNEESSVRLELIIHLVQQSLENMRLAEEIWHESLCEDK